MSIQQQQQPMPIVLLREGTTETKGNQAQRNNITAAKTIAEIVRTSLGPRGMDKMLVNNIGDVTITNDGATILKEMDIQHPAAKMMVEISKATDNEVGDGTTSTVVLAGSLLSKAEELIAKDVHPTVIVDGYRMASDKAIEMLKNASTKVDPTDRQILGKIARTSMASKLVSVNAEPLSKLVVDAVIAVAEKASDNSKDLRVDADSIKVEKKAGGSIEDTKLIRGIVLDKEVVHGAMPKRIEDAKIALLNAALEIEKTEMSADYRMSDPNLIFFLL
jgi:chaperonin GroEL (HSP60 family)